MAFAQGTVDKPMSVDEFLALEIPAEATDVVVKGYIVGVVEGRNWKENASFTAPFSTASNLILAGSSTETDLEYCVPVQLPSGAVRTALSPSGHPENIGHEVILTGKHAKYFSVSGIKEISDYQWVGDAPVPPAVSVEQRGTKESPLSVADYLKYGADGATVEDCWLRGVIVGYVDGMSIEDAIFSATDDNVSVSNILVAASADVKDIAACIPVQLPKGEARSALNLKDNPGNLGKIVVMHGVREKYCNVTGLKSVDDYILEGGTPVEPDPVKYIYKGLEVPGGNDEGWTYEQGEPPEGLDYVWAWTDSYGIKGSSFKKLTDIPADPGANKADAWAISPVIDLDGCSDVELELQQCTNFFKGTQQQQALVFIREEGGEWKQIELTPAMTEDSWTFVDCTYDLAGYKGKKIQFGFNYKCDGEVSGTWEVKNLSVFGKDLSGVDKVIVGGECVRVINGDIIAPAGARVFNLNGVETDATGLAGGIYIVVCGDKAHKVVVK